MFVFFFYRTRHHRDLHVRTHSFPTRRSSDLGPPNSLRKSAPPLSGKPAAPARFSTTTDWPSLAASLSAMMRVAMSVVIENRAGRSEEHTSELQSLMRISYAVFCLQKKRYSTANS